MEKQAKWTRFMDMHSGGSSKEKWSHIFIEADEATAKIIFYNRFGHNPERVTCTCCGEDYSISEADSLESITGYERGCEFVYLDAKGNELTWDQFMEQDGSRNPEYTCRYVDRPSSEYIGDNYRTLKEYTESGEALIIYAKDIKAEEMHGELPEQGYVWV